MQEGSQAAALLRGTTSRNTSTEDQVAERYRDLSSLQSFGSCPKITSFLSAYCPFSSLK